MRELEERIANLERQVATIGARTDEASRDACESPERRAALELEERRVELAVALGEDPALFSWAELIQNAGRNASDLATAEKRRESATTRASAREAEMAMLHGKLSKALCVDGKSWGELLSEAHRVTLASHDRDQAEEDSEAMDNARAALHRRCERLQADLSAAESACAGLKNEIEQARIKSDNNAQYLEYERTLAEERALTAEKTLAEIKARPFEFLHGLGFRLGDASVTIQAQPSVDGMRVMLREELRSDAFGHEDMRALIREELDRNPNPAGDREFGRIAAALAGFIGSDESLAEAVARLRKSRDGAMEDVARALVSGPVLLDLNDHSWWQGIVVKVGCAVAALKLAKQMTREMRTALGISVMDYSTIAWEDAVQYARELAEFRDRCRNL